MKLEVIVHPEFQGIVSRLLKQEMPIKTAFKFRKLAQQIYAETCLYAELKKELLFKYVPKDEEGTPIMNAEGFSKMSEANLELFIVEHKNLISVEIDLQHLTLDELGDKMSITPQELANLNGFIRE